MTEDHWSEETYQAIALLGGIVHENEAGLPILEYMSEADEEKGRRALADILKAGNPPQEICDLLADLIASDDYEFGAERKLVFKFRNRQRRRTDGTSVAADLRDGEIAFRVMHTVESGSTVEKAIATVAAQVGLSEERVKQIWKDFALSRAWQNNDGRKPLRKGR